MQRCHDFSASIDIDMMVKGSWCTYIRDHFHRYDLLKECSICIEIITNEIESVSLHRCYISIWNPPSTPTHLLFLTMTLSCHSEFHVVLHVSNLAHQRRWKPGVNAHEKIWYLKIMLICLCNMWLDFEVPQQLTMDSVNNQCAKYAST